MHGACGVILKSKDLGTSLVISPRRDVHGRGLIQGPQGLVEARTAHCVSFLRPGLSEGIGQHQEELVGARPDLFCLLRGEAVIDKGPGS